jgi:hypothetical protein
MTRPRSLERLIAKGFWKWAPSCHSGIVEWIDEDAKAGLVLDKKKMRPMSGFS